MLALVTEAEGKNKAQAALERNLKRVLKRQGIRNIGFPGGNADQVVYSAGKGELWAAFGGLTEGSGTRRYWNAFGVYAPERHAQTITVEINIPMTDNRARVGGFFAEDSGTREIFLMHSGKVGGGRPGIGKSAFLVWSRAKLVEVVGEGGVRYGIAIGKIDEADLAGRIWRFVQQVQRFKDEAVAGKLDTPGFKRSVEEFERYRKEFSGEKQSAGGRPFAYITYHGDIVQKLYEQRIGRLGAGEEVSNSPLIDLFVNKDGALSEVYEVKTGVGRQMLYTAIGQLVAHAAGEGRGVAKILVVPADEIIPADLEKALATLGVDVRRFRLMGRGVNRNVELE
jgi:hypothetical protein